MLTAALGVAATATLLSGGIASADPAKGSQSNCEQGWFCAYDGDELTGFSIYWTVGRDDPDWHSDNIGDKAESFHNNAPWGGSTWVVLYQNTGHSGSRECLQPGEIFDPAAWYWAENEVSSHLWTTQAGAAQRCSG
ncbi:peptidase inhibitor family I36 protein [Amycolatopsis anabasis]|uniref:peptidase inhibitor family I36 protein n=1 Tax=Amycolatopsis anabasis TaxID=1840409 RepID=UPI00131DA64D|nr:peptidase inhibitor family I36 protein [Amycolatopsis anabasis]